jgi:hypothetical protein
MRGEAVIRGVPITTTLSGLKAAVHGLKAKRRLGQLEVCSLQEFHRHTGFRIGRKLAPATPTARKPRGRSKTRAGAPDGPQVRAAP